MDQDREAKRILLNGALAAHGAAQVGEGGNWILEAGEWLRNGYSLVSMREDDGSEEWVLVELTIDEIALFQVNDGIVKVPGETTMVCLASPVRTAEYTRTE